MAIASPSPGSKITRATRWAWRLPRTSPDQHRRQTAPAPPARAAIRRARRHVMLQTRRRNSHRRLYASRPSASDLSGLIVGERGSAGRLEQPQQQRDCERSRGKGNDDAGDQQTVRHRVTAEARRRAPARDRAEQQEHAVADQVEREDLAQRLRIRHDAVEPEADQRCGAQSDRVSARSSSRRPFRRPSHQQGEGQHECGHQRSFDDFDQ